MHWVEVGKEVNKQAALKIILTISLVLNGRTEILILKHGVCPFYQCTSK